MYGVSRRVNFSANIDLLGPWLCHRAIKFHRRLIFAIGSRHRLMFTTRPTTPTVFCINPYAILSCLCFAMLEMFFSLFFISDSQIYKGVMTKFVMALDRHAHAGFSRGLVFT